MPRIVSVTWWRALMGGVAVLATLPLPADQPATFEVTPGTPASVGSRPAVPALPVDVVSFDPRSDAWTLLASLRNWIPAGVEVDAVVVFSSGYLVFSTDTSVTVGSVSAQDEDLLLYHVGPRRFEMFFDGSAAGLPPEADLDAAWVDTPFSNKGLLFSVDTVVEIGGLTARPSDILGLGRTGVVVVTDGASMFGSGADEVDITGLALLDDDRPIMTIDRQIAFGAGPFTPEDLLVYGPKLTLYRRLSDDGFPRSGAGIRAVDVQYPPGLRDGTFSPGVVSTSGPVSVRVVVDDADGDPPKAVRGRLTTTWYPLARQDGCGPPLCDDRLRNGEAYVGTISSVPAGVTTQLRFDADDGRNIGVYSIPGPTYVSLPGDADGDGDIDAADIARIVAELADGNDSTSIGDVRSGSLTDSWGGTDAYPDLVVDTADIVLAILRIY